MQIPRTFAAAALVFVAFVGSLPLTEPDSGVNLSINSFYVTNMPEVGHDALLYGSVRIENGLDQSFRVVFALDRWPGGTVVGERVLTASGTTIVNVNSDVWVPSHVGERLGFFQIDPMDEVAEVDEFDNGGRIVFRIGHPDLVVDAIEVGPEPFLDHKSIIITAHVRNAGTSFSDPSEVTFGVGGLFHASVAIPELSAGEVVVVSAPAWRGDAGTHQVWVGVDAGNQNEEAIESNNERSTSIVVAARQPEDLEAWYFEWQKLPATATSYFWQHLEWEQVQFVIACPSATASWTIYYDSQSPDPVTHSCDDQVTPIVFEVPILHGDPHQYYYVASKKPLASTQGFVEAHVRALRAYD